MLHDLSWPVISTQKMISNREFLRLLYLLVSAAKIACNTNNPVLYPIADFVCAYLGWKYPQFEAKLQDVYRICLNGTYPYSISLDPDRTPSQAAADNRRKRENRIVIDGYPRFSIDMREKHP